MIQEGIAKIVDGKDLAKNEAEQIMEEIMAGNATSAQIATFLTALRIKGETVGEIVALASIMRKFCHQIHPKIRDTLVDTCGTGGDKIKTFNISTIAAFVAAGAGGQIAKHGNRSVTSRCGSADVLEILGFNLKMTPDMVERSIEEIGIGFMFAPIFHPAMKYAIGPRREIKIRTVFNILGPLTNPANAKAQLLGVYDDYLTEPLAHVLDNLGLEQGMVVHGVNGLDEISIIGQTKITYLKQGEVTTSYIHPEDLGVNTVDSKILEGSTPDKSGSMVFRILSNQKSRIQNKDEPKRDITLVNAAAAIQVGGRAETIKEGMQIARESIESGSAYEKLKSLIKFSEGDLSRLEAMENYE